MSDEPQNDDTETPAAPADSAAPPTPEQERDALQDRLLRTAAEFDNYRKRVERERRDLSDAIAADVLAGLLPILDDLERALQVEAGSDASVYRQGVELIHGQLADLIRKRGATPIEALGTDFDPNVHEAVVHEESPGHREGEVIGEFRRGYMIGDRLLRASMVKVAKA